MIAVLIILALTSACGDETSEVPPPGPDAPFESVEPDERTVVIELIEAVAGGFDGTDAVAENQLLVELLRAQPIVRHAGVDGETVWVIYADGVGHLISDIAIAPDNAMGRSNVAPDPGRQASSASSVPGTRYKTLNAFGNFFNDSDRRLELRALLDQKGYANAGGSDTADLDTLRSIANYGVLYFRGHGDEADTTFAGKVLGLWTTIRRDVNLESRGTPLGDDLWNRRLGFGTLLDRYERWPPFPGVKETHYMFTDAFIDHYWGRFDQNSLVYLDACSSALFTDIHAALARKGVSVVMGWDELVRVGVAGQTSTFLFDRMLGTNQVRPETPTQRPFGYSQLFAKHVGAGKRVGHDTFKGATMRAIPLGGDFGLLAPSIHRVAIDEDRQELTLHGLFGNDPGPGDHELVVGSTTLTHRSWANDRLVYGDFVPSVVGIAELRVNEHPSNRIPITRWPVTLRLTIDVSPMFGLPVNSLRQLVDCTLVFRADIHPRRNAPADTPVLPNVRGQGTRDMVCSFAHLGTATGADGTQYTLSGSGNMMWEDDNTAQHIGDHSSIMYEYIGPSLTLRITPHLVTEPTGTELTIESQGFTATLGMPLAGVPEAVDIALLPDFTAPAGMTTGTSPNGATWRLEWDAITVSNRPGPGETVP